MHIALLVLLVALAAAYGMQRRGNAAAKAALPIILALTLILVAVHGVRTLHRPAPQVNFSFDQAAACVLGKHLVSALPRAGPVLVFPDKGGLLSNAQRKGLEEALAGSGFERVDFPTPPEEEEVAFDDGLWSGQLRNVLQAHPDVVAFVSFRGLPIDFTAGDLDRLPPLFLVDDAREGTWLPLLQSGHLRAAVTLRHTIDWDANPAPGATPEEIFDLRYELVTAGH